MVVVNKVILDNTFKQAYIIDVSIPNRHSLHCAVTYELQKLTHLQEELVRILHLKPAYIIALVLSQVGIVSN